MFNVSTFYKKLTEAKLKHDKVVKEARQRNLFLKKREKFAENYKKRVDQFIMEMAYEPIIYKDHKSPLDCSPRTYDSSKFQGGHIMIMRGYRTERDRIQDSIAQNSYLDNGGANFTKQRLRKRDEAKEINPTLRFKAKSTIERVMDAVYAQQMIQSQTPKTYNKKQNSHTPQTLSKKELAILQSPKNILDQLHRKTHFKAVQSISLGGQHNSLSGTDLTNNQGTATNKKGNSNVQQVAKVANQQEQSQTQPETQQVNTKQRMDMSVPLTQEETIQHATQVLQECNVQNVRKLPPLIKGSGRLMGTSQYTNREIYQMQSNFRSIQSSQNKSLL